MGRELGVTSRVAGLTHAQADWAGLRVCVTGLGVSGFAAADALAERGAQVTLVDAARPAPGTAMAERANILDILGITLVLGESAATALPPGTWDLVVTSPGWAPHHPVLEAAAAAGIPIWGDVELAWRLRPATGAAPWLALTGTNGKTTTVQMLASILGAAGLRTLAVGNVGTPILEAVLDPTPYDVLAVELSSFQLHWSQTLAPEASAVLNLAPDHLDWHGSMEHYRAAKARIYQGTEKACIYNVADPQTERMVEEAEVQPGCRAIGFTTGVPGLSMLGVVDGILADRAFIPNRRDHAAELGTVADLAPDGQPSPHYLANALAAAALARAHGVPAAAVRDGLASFVPDRHRGDVVGVDDAGVAWVDDSKATNPHAAAAALAAYPSVVWIAGGLLKGASVDDLVRGSADRLRAVVLIGRDRDEIAQALARHAPDVPTVDCDTRETDGVDVMDVIVARAAELAQPGDTVLLAPAAASMDMFANYGARGDAFTAAVRKRLH